MSDATSLIRMAEGYLTQLAPHIRGREGALNQRVLMRSLVDALRDSESSRIADRAHIQQLEAEIARLRRGEYICTSCGLRQDAKNDHGETPF